MKPLWQSFCIVLFKYDDFAKTNVDFFFLNFLFEQSENFVKPKFNCANSQMNQSDLKEIHDSSKRRKVSLADYAGIIF